MIKIIDRQMIRGYFKAYFVCLISLLSLYVVVDLFSNLDEFTRTDENFLAVLQHIGTYYGIQGRADLRPHVRGDHPAGRDVHRGRGCSATTNRCRCCSAGVSTRRIVLPVLLCAWSMLSLAVLNQEMIIPRIASQLILDKSTTPAAARRWTFTVLTSRTSSTSTATQRPAKEDDGARLPRLIPETSGRDAWST